MPTATHHRPATKSKAKAKPPVAARGKVPASHAVADKPATRAARRPRSAPKVEARLRIRLYRHGLGDCILLRFRKDDGEGTFNVLIDCGLISVAEKPKEKMLRVAQDIEKSCNGRLDVVVMTHEHWDHVSGFHASQARSVFDAMSIGEVWYGWTEDPRNELGRRLRAERAEKLNALASAVNAFAHIPGMESRAKELGGMLGFFGLTPGEPRGTRIGRTRDAFEYLQGKQDVKTRMQIGRADGIEVTVPQGEATVQVDLPDRNLTESRSLPVTAQTHLAVNLTRTGELKLTEAPEGFRYA